MPKTNEKGIAHLALIILGVLGIAIGLYLVGTRTNFLPSAQQDLLPPETSFRLQLQPRYQIWDANTNEQNVGTDESRPNHSIDDSIKPGETFNVDVLVASDIDSANAFAAFIGFPKDLVEVQSIIKESPETAYKHPELDSILVQLIKTKERGDANIEELAKGWGLEMKDGKVKVTLRTYPKFNTATANLAQYGFEQIAAYETLIDGYAIIDTLYKLVEVDYVDYISAAYKPMTNENSTTAVSRQSNLDQPAGSGCKVGGCSGQVCQNSTDDDIVTTCEWKDTYACYRSAKCEKQSSGQCGWTETPELQSCLGGGERVCAQVITRACNLQEVQCIKEPCYPQEVCKDFPTPCDVPEGWYLEKNKCTTDTDCRGTDQFCDYLNHPPRNPDIKVCKTRTYSCWERCSDDVLKQADSGSGSCNEALFPYQSITLGDTVSQVRGCAVNETGGVLTCDRGVLKKENYTKTPFCQPKPSCKPIPSCVNSNPACDIYIDPNDPSWCHEVPVPSCKPIPPCAYSNPACDIYIDPNDPTWCREQNYIKNYFIQFWLPDTQFDNENGKLVLSGGVSNPGIKTSSWQKPVMATIVFKALKAGEARLDFTDDSLILRNSDSTNILTKKEGLSVTISEQPLVRGDLDGDGVVGFKDFSILLSKWGGNDKKADLNGDGKVNIYDFSAMLSNWVGKKGRIKKCPEQWIQNVMPSVVDDSGSDAGSASEYFIYEGKRRELHEFDRDWVKSNCRIQPEKAY